MRKISPNLLVLTILLFLLPWVRLSCGGQKIATFSGMDLAIGKTIEIPFGESKKALSTHRFESGKPESEPLLVGLVSFRILSPAFIYKNGDLGGFEKEFEAVIDKKTYKYGFADPRKAKTTLEEFERTKFWLYWKGNLIGEFNSKGLLEDFPPQIVGEVVWKSSKYKEKIEKEKETVTMIALSQPIGQPFWPKMNLTPAQSQKLKKTIDSAFSTAFQKFKVNPKWFSKKRTSHPPKVEIMDLEQDGQPEVFVMTTWRPDVEGRADDIGVSLLLSWQNNQWLTLLYGFYKVPIEGEDLEEIEEGCITALWPLNTNDDGKADVIISKKPAGPLDCSYEVYQVHKEKIRKILQLEWTYCLP